MKHRAKLLMSIRVVAPGENSGKEVANQHHGAQSDRSEMIGNQPCGRQRTVDVPYDPASNGPNWPPCRSPSSRPVTPGLCRRLMVVIADGVSFETARSLPYPFVLTARAENFIRGRPDLDDTLWLHRPVLARGAR
jgi:hypothetical protein